MLALKALLLFGTKNAVVLHNSDIKSKCLPWSMDLSSSIYILFLHISYFKPLGNRKYRLSRRCRKVSGFSYSSFLHVMINDPILCHCKLQAFESDLIWFYLIWIPPGWFPWQRPPRNIAENMRHLNSCVKMDVSSYFNPILD